MQQKFSTIQILACHMHPQPCTYCCYSASNQTKPITVQSVKQITLRFSAASLLLCCEDRSMTSLREMAYKMAAFSCVTVSTHSKSSSSRITREDKMLQSATKSIKTLSEFSPFYISQITMKTIYYGTHSLCPLPFLYFRNTYVFTAAWNESTEKCEVCHKFYL